ncbi:MAG: M28 family peptidase [Acidobacteriota bacterium]|nr:M28 family peptidase [Acidobacteriota bacterium]
MRSIRSRSRWVFPLLFLLAAGCTPPGDDGSSESSGPSSPPQLTLTADADEAAQVIDAATLESMIASLADDSLAGRGPATEGDQLTRTYIAEALAECGFEPGAADGSWEQPVELVGLTSHMPKEWTFNSENDTLSLDFWDDYIGNTGVQEPSVSIDDAELVFVGYGITAPEEDWNDYKDVDVRGKILVMLNNDPDWDPDLFAGSRRLYYGRWDYKYESAAKAGAVGAIIIHTTPSAGYPFQVVQTSWTGEQFEAPAGNEPRVRLTAWVTDEAAGRLARLGGLDLDELIASAHSRDFRPVSLNVRSSIAFESTVNEGTHTANVLGILPGSDPELADELVVYTAHHDHLGIGATDADGDSIYNGARDNASGVATVLAIARAFSALEERPRRSVLMLLVAAEEQGLLGSEAYTNDPTAHPGNLMANINFDAVAIFGRTTDVAVVGRGKSELELLLEQAAAKQDREVVDEPFPDKGYYYRSDQFNFAKIGVPALYFKSGTHLRDGGSEVGKALEDEWRANRYHQPADEIYDGWDFSGMIEDAQLGFWVGLSVANMDSPPGWVAGDEFEGTRKQMRAEARESE